MPTARNRLAVTISNTPGTASGFTVSTALAGMRGFAAGDNGLTFDLIVTEGTAWEVINDATYTHASTALSRGTLEDSSTGSRINFTNAAVVRVTSTAGRANTHPGLNAVAMTGTKDGSNAAFTIPDGTVASVFVVLNGLWLSVAGGGFTRAGATITMQSGYIPQSTDDLYAVVA